VSLNASPLEYIVLGVEGMEFAADENGDRRYSAFNFHSGREDILPYLRGMLRRSSRNPQVTKSSARIFWRFWSLS
jgi:hypothetical protein